MNIGIEAQRLLRPHKHGMDVVALELVRALDALDSPHTFHVLVRPDTDRTCLEGLRRVKVVEVPGYHYVHWEQVQLPRMARRLGLDVLHCTANTAPLRLSVPLVLTLHDVIFMDAGPVGGTAYQRWGNAYRSWLVPRIIRRAARIATVSYDERARVVSMLRLPEAAVEVVYNGVSTRFGVAPTPEQRRAVQEELAIHTPYVLLLGNAEPRKNVPRALAAFSQVADQYPGLRLVVTGLAAADVQSMLSDVGGSAYLDRLVCPGYLPADLLPAVYAGASAFLYPSLREGFGLPILEAMAAGIPVVTSLGTSTAEVADAAGYLVDPTRAEAIAEGLRAALTDDATRRHKVALGLERPTLFSWTGAARRWIELYESVQVPDSRAERLVPVLHPTLDVGRLPS
jgi:glycosyltransferase involved in cell wall biosynthesis